ncbi:MAG: restriction endonuclease [Bacillota bacterium]|nr:restriction endonuclease [Bacillota bacterium]
MNINIDLSYFFNVLLVIFAFVMLTSLIRYLPDLIMDLRYKRVGLDETDNMSGREFEYWLKSQFKRMNYKVTLHRGYKDKGADLIVINSQGQKFAVQAKKLNSGSIGAKVIGEALRGKLNYKCDRALVVTNQKFTEQALEEAEACGVILWDRKKLLEILEDLKARGK